MTFKQSEYLAVACADLLEILTYGRPHNTPEEALFIRTFVDSLAKDTGRAVETDMYGNRWVSIPYPEDFKGPRVLWSCHVDTMHAKGGRQQLAWISESTVGLYKKKAGRCLGADDGAGVYLLREMIVAGVPGTYVFHRGEECGRLGSKHVKDVEPERLKGFDACVAFDRKGTDNLITFQMGERGCSAAFADSLSVALADASGGLLDYQADPTGSYTDSYSYFGHIRECTNLSVGYQREHGPNETLDVAHVWALRCALVRADFTGLAIEQDTYDREYDWGDCGGGYGGYYGSGGFTFGRAGGGRYYGRNDAGHIVEGGGGGWRDTSDDDPAWSGSRSSFDEEPLVTLCREYPDTAASLLDALGIDAGTFLDELQAANGTLPAKALEVAI